MTKMNAVSSFFDSRYFWYLFAVLTVFVYFFGLSIPLLGPDEPRYAQVAREMFERGDWVTPTLGGSHWFEKPALLYWLQKISFGMFGISEFSARVGSALFGLGTIACVLLIGRSVAAGNGVTGHDNRRSGEIARSGSAQAANYLGLVAASTLGIIVFSRGASFDIILTFPIAASMTGFFLFDRSRPGERSRVIGLAAFYFFMGVAVLAKGLVGFVFPFAIVALYHTFRWQMPSRDLTKSIFWGLPFAVLTAASWYLPMYVGHGWEFIDEFFIQHHFQRYTSNKYRHPQPFYFFFWVLPLMTIPWIPFFFAAIWSNIREARLRLGTPPQSETGDDGKGSRPPFDAPASPETAVSTSPFTPLLLFSYAWMLVPLVFFSFSGSKLPGYVLPSVPPAMIIAGVAAYRFSLRSPGRDLLVKLLGAVTLVVIVLVIHCALPRFAESDSVKGLIASADERGYSAAPIAGFMTVSHNAEFYGAGRIKRNADGTQMRLDSTADVARLLDRSGGQPLLLIVRQEQVQRLKRSPEIDTEVLGQSGSYAIVSARKR
jgi:4-amino-4-deoxy-L-arabinose transferase-like glycosyltransferase